MSTTRRRVARKPHSCGWDHREIAAGEVYLVHTVYPGNDVYDVPVPHRLAECSDCATRYGRAALLAVSA